MEKRPKIYKIYKKVAKATSTPLPLNHEGLRVLFFCDIIVI